MQLQKLTTIEFKGESKLGNGTLQRVPKLKSITFGAKIDLGSGALVEAGVSLVDKMNPIVIPAGSTVGSEAFLGSKLSSVEFLDTNPPEFGSEAFAGCPEDAVIYVPEDSLEAYTKALNEPVGDAVEANPESLQIVGKKARYTVIVHHGSGNGKYEEKTIVTIKADVAPEGKQFDKWVVVSGEISFEDETAEETTFVMPAENVEVTATYKD